MAHSYRLVTLILIPLVFLTGCTSAFEKIVERGDTVRQRGDLERAAEVYLEAFERETPEADERAEANQRLKEVAEPAYNAKLERAENKEDTDPDESIEEYEELGSFISKLERQIEISFGTVNTDERILAVQNREASQYYKQAEQLFADERYDDAIGYYESALEYVDSYEDAQSKIEESKDRLAERFYVRAEEQFEDGSYARAIENYEAAQDYRRSYRDSRQKVRESKYRMANRMARNGNYLQAAAQYVEINRYRDSAVRGAEIYYRVGNYHMSRDECLTAYVAFMRGVGLDSSFENLAQRGREAKDCATNRVAIADFENRTGQNPAGMALQDYLYDDVYSGVSEESSSFVKVLTRQELLTLLNEARISMQGIEGAGSLPDSFEGADYVVSGRLTQVMVNEDFDSQPQTETYAVRNGNQYSYEKKTRENFNGETETYVEETVTPNYERGRLTYVANRESRSVIVAGTIRVLEVATRSQVASWSFDEEVQDEVEYVTDFRMQHDLSADSVEIAIDPSDASGGAQLGAYAFGGDETREGMDMLYELNDGAISEDRVLGLINEAQQDRPRLANVSSLLRDGFSNGRSERSRASAEDRTESTKDYGGYWDFSNSGGDRSREPRGSGSNEVALLTRIAERAKTEILNSVEVDMDAARRRLRAPSSLNLSFLSDGD